MHEKDTHTHINKEYIYIYIYINIIYRHTRVNQPSSERLQRQDGPESFSSERFECRSIGRASFQMPKICLVLAWLPFVGAVKCDASAPTTCLRAPLVGEGSPACKRRGRASWLGALLNPLTQLCWLSIPFPSPKVDQVCSAACLGFEHSGHADDPRITLHRFEGFQNRS